MSKVLRHPSEKRYFWVKMQVRGVDNESGRIG